jgi:hypothetical protein
MKTFEEKLKEHPVHFTKTFNTDPETFQPILVLSFELPLEVTVSDSNGLSHDEALEILATHIKQQFITTFDNWD